VGEANDLTPRPNPANGNTGIHRYHQIPLAGKRLSRCVVTRLGRRGWKSLPNVDVAEGNPL
jgi:hypothetical protein